jgi:hypothetical protein
MTLFSPAHIENQKKIHEDCPAYGHTSLVFAPMVSELVNSNQVNALLDYGSGLGKLGENLELDSELAISLYDPAFPDIASPPEPTEMVVCVDVMDNVEVDSIDAVLDDLQRVTERLGFFAINTETADRQELNIEASQSLYPVEWWLPKILDRFELHYFSRINYGFVVVVKAKTAN